MPDHDRREFLRTAALASAALGVGGLTQRTDAAEAAKVERRMLGKTGSEVGMLSCGLGSQFIGPYAGKPDEAFALLQRALEVHGCDYWDTASSYSVKMADGTRLHSEDLIGPAVKRFRDQLFLVSKTANRTYDGYKRDLERSLTRLQTDHLDVYHLHNLDPKRDQDLAAIENGALRAAREAKEQGVIKHIGFTGHVNAQILVDALQAFEPDVLMTTFPATRPDHGKFETELLPLAVERGVGVIAMKLFRQAQGSQLKGSDLARYALSLEGICVANIGLDSVEHLDQNAAMASSFQRMTALEREQVHRRTMLALGEATPPWLQYGYQDGIV